MLNCVLGKLYLWRYCEIQKSGNFQTLYTVPTKHKHFGIKIYKQNDIAGYACGMKFYLGKVQYTDYYWWNDDARLLKQDLNPLWKC